MAFVWSMLFVDPLIILSTLVCGAISFTASFFEKDGATQAAIARFWARSLLMIAGVTVTVEGIEKIKPGKPYVFVANHLSYMDTPVVLGNIPVQFRFLAKSGLFQIPLLGTHLTRAGHIPVPRDNARAAVKTMTTAAQAIRTRGISLLIFPEGGRSQDGELAAFKEGAAYIAIRAGVSLVPIALKGTREVLPFGSGHVRSGLVTMRIGEPIPTDQVQLHDRGRLTADIRDRIVSLLEEQPIHA